MATGTYLSSSTYTSPASRFLAISILMPSLAAMTTLLAPFNFRSCDSIKLQPEMSAAVRAGSDDAIAVTHPVGPAPRSRTTTVNRFARYPEFV